MVGFVRSHPDIYFSSAAENKRGAGVRIGSCICHIHLSTASVSLSTGGLMSVMDVGLTAQVHSEFWEMKHFRL